jgi:hypothetical protein
MPVTSQFLQAAAAASLKTIRAAVIGGAGTQLKQGLHMTRIRHHTKGRL